jgi:hypothetical protein
MWFLFLLNCCADEHKNHACANPLLIFPATPELDLNGEIRTTRHVTGGNGGKRRLGLPTGAFT